MAKRPRKPKKPVDDPQQMMLKDFLAQQLMEQQLQSAMARQALPAPGQATRGIDPNESLRKVAEARRAARVGPAPVVPEGVPRTKTGAFVMGNDAMRTLPKPTRVGGADYHKLWGYLPKSWARAVRPAIGRAERPTRLGGTVKGTPPLGWLGKARESVKAAYRKQPLWSAAGALGTASLVAGPLARLGESFLEGIGILPGAEKRLGQQREAMQQGLMSQERNFFEMQQHDMLTRQNAARLMQIDPGMAQQLMAGRRLPQGATVIGGQPRTDILNRAAAMLMEQQQGAMGM